MLFPKCLIVNDTLRLGMVNRHSELAKNSKKENIKGGGLFDIDEETKTIILSQKSFEYGLMSQNDLKEIIQNKKIQPNRYLDYKFQYSYFGELIDLAQ